MDFFGYPLWVVLLLCMGVFCASFMDAIGGGGGIISLPCYLLAGLPVHFALGTNKLSSCIGTVASTVRYVKTAARTGYWPFPPSCLHCLALTSAPGCN